MDNHHYAGHGHISLLVSILMGVFAWVGALDFSEVLKIAAGLVSVVAGIMAIRYYYYATKKIKNNVGENK